MIGNKYNLGPGFLKRFLNHPSPQDELTRILPSKSSRMIMLFFISHIIMQSLFDAFDLNSHLSSICDYDQD